MGPAHLKMFVFLALCFAVVSSESKIVSRDAADDPDEFVCHSQVTIHSPACRMVSAGLKDMAHRLDQLQQAVSDLVDMQKKHPKDCADALANGAKTSGVYTIQPGLCSSYTLKVYCDMDTDGGGWTVFQRRQDGSVDFYRDWESYRLGFGDVDGEFWLGNDNLHRLTADGNYELRVEYTELASGNSSYSVYKSFRVADALDDYRLTVGDYSSETAIDIMTYQNNMRFSTKDRDNDRWYPDNCATMRKGAWWYNTCYYINPNGEYKNHFQLRDVLLENPKLKSSEMKLRWVK